MKLSRIGILAVGLVLAVGSILLLVGNPAKASADNLYTCTWTGTGGDGLFSDAANWNGCSGAPQPDDDDTLVFPSSALSQNVTLTDDISGALTNSFPSHTGLAVYNLLFNGTSSQGYNYTIVPSSGNVIYLNHGITVSGANSPTIDTDVSLYADQTFQGTGSFNLGDANHTPVLDTSSQNVGIGSGSDSLSVNNNGGNIAGSGTITVNSGATLNLATSSNSGWNGSVIVGPGGKLLSIQNGLGSVPSVMVQNTGNLILCGYNGGNFATNLTIAGTDAISTAADCSHGASNQYDSTASINLTGNLTLTANSTVSTDGTITVSGPLSGAYTLGIDAGVVGNLVIVSSSNSSSTANGTYSSPVHVITVPTGDNQPNQSVVVGNNNEYIIDGTRGATEVKNGGILKGDGTVGSLLVDPGGTVSPGHSPGCITETGNLNEGGIYQAEIGGTTACSGYDQLIVTAGNRVILDNGGSPATQGILQLSLVDGFIPSKGQAFEIINNQGNSPITDTFSGFPEGSTITFNGYQFKISYKGGDGNDVVLTYVSKVAAPGAPNTGFGLISSHFSMTLIGSMTAAAGIYMISRKLGGSSISKKRR
ncbi:MAG TPA: hypothetical protein VIH90_00775 [Candidatus Saccharimonadales bacterium]